MILGGLQKTSLIDYPDKLSAIVFTVGCNFRCGFCYNPELVLEDKRTKQMPEQNFFKFLEKRKKMLDAVVVTGGEPTLHKDLPDFIGKIKGMGYLVKLDTNGTNPVMLKKLIRDNLIDYIAMDIKAPIKKYDRAVNVKLNKGNIKKSIKIIIDSGLDYEFRSTILPALHAKQDLVEMAKMIKGAKKYWLQKFMASRKMIDPAYRQLNGFTGKDMKELADLCGQYVQKCKVRG